MIPRKKNNICPECKIVWKDKKMQVVCNKCKK